MKYFSVKVEVEEYEAGMKTITRGGIMNGRQASRMTQPVTEELKVPVKAEKIEEVRDILAKFNIHKIASIKEVSFDDFELISQPSKIRTIRTYFSSFELKE